MDRQRWQQESCFRWKELLGGIGMDTRIISFLNVKGGVGKTSSAVNIAAALSCKGYRVLVIDIDPQANATRYLGCSDKQNHKNTVLNILTGGTVKYIKTEYENLYLVPASMGLLKVQGSDQDGWNELMLKTWTDMAKDAFDFILIDCPPSLNNLTANALVASTDVLLPLKIDQFGADGFSHLIDVVKQIGIGYGNSLRFLGAFITMDKATTINKSIKQELNEKLGNLVFNQTIRDNVAVIKSTFAQKPVVFYDKKANASKDYITLTEEVIRKCLG